MFEENNRLTRITDHVQKTIAKILLQKINDPRLSMTTVSAVKVSKDLSHAKVYVTFLEEEDKQEKLKALKKASGYIRKLLAEELDLRITPELKFVYDEALKRGMRVAKLIDQANAELSNGHESGQT